MLPRPKIEPFLLVVVCWLKGEPLALAVRIQVSLTLVSASQVLLKEEWDKVRLAAVHGDLRRRPLLQRLFTNKRLS